MKKEITDELKLYIDPENVKENECMAAHTSFKCGGNAALFIEPKSLAELMSCVQILKKQACPFLIIGNGTNTLFTDSGYEGAVVKVGEGLDRVHVDGNTIYAEPGILLSQLARIAADNSLSGLEFACGIPGSLGGGVFMNAGAYGGELKNVITLVSSISPDGKVHDRRIEKLDMGYRRSCFMENGEIIIGVKLQLEKADRIDIEIQMRENNKKRNEKQPVSLPSAGSFFKRPEGYFAGKLIEDAGLKGLKVGGAQVSPLHAGFVVNADNASATDIIDLMKVVQETVYDKFGVKLEPEVRIVGE